MPRKFLNKLIPNRQKLNLKLSNTWYGRPFKELLHDPALWHINRRGSCGAVSMGLFICILPVPGHTPLAMLGALYWRFNLPLAAIIVWFNNPFSFGPIYYFSYRLGASLLHLKPHKFPDGLSLSWLISEFSRIWEPLWLGCIIVGSLLALIGYVVLSITWQISIRLRWTQRQQARAQKNNSN
ncbi:MAG TPA: DUF2062 domain-containing protein [Gammaproteobacteria bacterium]|nr:DUF2062 domain-containing protein [Gammaproteobacteria bacterium]